MNRHNWSRLAATPIAIVVTLGSIGCPGKKDDSSPVEVHDDVFVTGSANNRIVLDGDTAFIVNSFENTVDMVDLTTCTDVAGSCQADGEVQLPAGSGPYDLALTSTQLHVAGLVSDKLYTVDRSTLMVTGEVDSSGSLKLSTPQGVLAVGTKLLVSNGNGFGFGPGYLSVVEGGNLTSNVPTTQMNPIGMTVLPDGDIAVANGGKYDFNAGTVTSDGGIDIVDATTLAVTRNLPLGPTLPGPVAVVSADGQDLFVPSGIYGPTQMMKVNIATGASQVAVLSSAASFVSHVVVDGDTVYALSFTEDRIYALDAATLAPVDIELESGSVPFLSVGPGGQAAKGPVHAVIWEGDGRKHMFVLMTLSNSMTDVVLP